MANIFFWPEYEYGSQGSSHASILGEAIINLADYADASNPFVVALPLHGSDQGTILHVRNS